MKYEIIGKKQLAIDLKTGKRTFSDWQLIGTATTKQSALRRLRAACGKGKLGGWAMAQIKDWELLGF